MRTLARTMGLASATLAVALGAGGLAASAGPSHRPQPASLNQEVLWGEDFESIPNPTGFTHRMPNGWQLSNSGFTSGEARWAGWSLTTMRDWTWAAGTDQRHYFTRAHGQFAAVDSNHQRLNATDRLNTVLSSPALDVKNRGSLVLEFDSHYRQGKPGQYASVQISYDGAAPTEALRLTADKYSSRESIALGIPAGARTAVVTFTYANGNDDWFWAIDNVRLAAPRPAEPAGAPRAVVDVLSDVQGGLANYTAAVKQLNAQPEKAGMLVVNGDTVDLGAQALYDEFRATRDATPHASGNYLYSIGNHEMYGPEGSETYIKRWLTFTGQEHVWTERVVDGIPSITINTEAYSDVDRGGKEPFVALSAEQLSWLDSHLAHWAKEGKPVLLYSHLVLPNTVSETHSAWYQNDFNDLEPFNEVVGKYSNVVLFTSHTHSSLTQNDWWGRYRADGTGNPDGFPVVNTGAILNAYMPDGDHDETILDGNHASGLRVKVYEDRVRVEAWDFVAQRLMKSVDFPVPAKAKG